MSKFGWSYPPGCTQAMVDEAVGADDPTEALTDAIYTAMEEASSDFGSLHGFQQDAIVAVAVKFCGESYQQGYQQGQSDEELARDYEDQNDVRPDVEQR